MNDLGPCGPQLLAAAGVALAAGSGEQGDVDLLCDLLYDRWYNPPRGDPAGSALGPAALVACLRAAHADARRFEEGWTVVDAAATAQLGPPTSSWQIAVSREPELRWVDPVDVVVPGGVGVRPPVGAEVLVAALRDSVDALPGWWIAASQTWTEPDRPVVRLYWSVPARYAPKVVTLLSSALDPKLASALKAATQPHRYRRADGVVVYLPDEDWPAVRDDVLRVHAAAAPFLQPHTPALALRLGTGFALAEDPGDSFGRRCCQVIGRGLAPALNTGQLDPARLAAAAAAALQARGVRLDAPHLRPGSRASYP